MTNINSRTVSAALLVTVFAMVPISGWAEEVGTSCADCPNYSGAFSIENGTNVTIHYQVRWGKSHPWKNIDLQVNHTETHSFPLGGDPHKSVPTPYIRFDRIGGDGTYTPQEYKMEFYAVGYAGYGAKQKKAEPKHYIFRYAENGRDLDLKLK
jgi:hypothetical protein